MNDYKLADSTIAHIAQLLQLAIVTGTDITDHFRMIRMEPSELVPEELTLTKQYSDQAEENLTKLVEEAQAVAAQAEKDQSKAKVM